MCRALALSVGPSTWVTAPLSHFPKDKTSQKWKRNETSPGDKLFAKLPSISPLPCNP